MQNDAATTNRHTASVCMYYVQTELNTHFGRKVPKKLRKSYATQAGDSKGVAPSQFLDLQAQTQNKSTGQTTTCLLFGSKCLCNNFHKLHNHREKIKEMPCCFTKTVILLCPCGPACQCQHFKGHHTASLAAESNNTGIKINMKTSTDDNLLSGGCIIDFSIIRVQSIQFKALSPQKWAFGIDSKGQR